MFVDFDWDWLNENGFDFQLITLHQSKRQNGMYDDESRYDNLV